MAKKALDMSLHTTVGEKWRGLPKNTGRITEGVAFIRKANMWMKYTKFNKKGQTDKEEYYEKA